MGQVAEIAAVGMGTGDGAGARCLHQIRGEVRSATPADPPVLRTAADPHHIDYRNTVAVGFNKRQQAAEGDAGFVPARSVPGPSLCCYVEDLHAGCREVAQQAPPARDPALIELGDGTPGGVVRGPVRLPLIYTGP